MTPEEILAKDRAHVWHPYGPMPGRTDPLVVTGARGTRLTLADGRELVDGMSSWWAAIHGYRHPVLDRAVHDQLARMSHVMFGGLTHEPAVRLATTLVEITPTGLEHVFLCDSGSVGVDLTRRHRVLLVFDEIATGFGRSGALFAADHAGVGPDVMCVGKALTGGYLSLAAALAEVAAGISAGQVPVLAHGPTFMANPLACAVAQASIELLLRRDWAAEVARIEAGLRAGLAPLHGTVADVRVLGAIGVVQLDRPVDVPAATAAAVAEGVWLRPFRDLIYTMPPYVAGDDDIARITRAMVAAAKEG